MDITSSQPESCQENFSEAPQTSFESSRLTQTYSPTFFLSTKHQSDIQARGLLNDWARKGCRTVTKEEATFYLGYEAKSGGILMSGQTTQMQFRPDRPWKKEGDKKAPKYRTPLTDHGCDGLLPTSPYQPDYYDKANLEKSCYQVNGHPCLIITEGFFKAIAGCSNDLPTIGLTGVENGLTGKSHDVQGKRYLIPILEKYARDGFGFIMAFDADAAVNPFINSAQRKLGRQLLKFKVPVYIATGNWEMGDNKETNGMDDLIQRKGIEAFRKALSAATDFKTWESKTFDSGDGDGPDKFLVRKNTTFEVHCRKSLFGSDWFVSDGGAFFQNCGTHWQLREDADVAKAIGDFAEECYELEEVGRNFKFGTSKNLEATLKYCRRTLHKKDKTANRHLKAFLNGTVDTRTGKLEPHNKEHYLLECSPYNYVENAGLPPTLKQFLLSSFGEAQIPAIRAFMSASLDPTAPYGRFPHFIGDSGDGKGTVLRLMENLVGSEASSSSQDFSELGKPEGRYQLLLGKSFFYIPDTGGFQSGLKAFYELVDNGPMSGRALYMPKAIQKKWNVRFAVASVEHLPIEHAGDGWNRRCYPIPTIKSTREVDPNLGQKLSEELGEIAGWALSMDKVERDNILTLPMSNPVLLALQQEGAIIGDGVKSFVDRCFLPGTETYYGSELHSWYQAYCKTHTLNQMAYQKFVQRLQRVLSKQWRPSEVSRVNGKPKRQPARWEGLQLLPCFVDLAELDKYTDDQKPSNNGPHIPNWICVKENCQDGGLQELTENPAVTDVTPVTPSVTPLENAETPYVTDVTPLHTQSLRNAKICDEMSGDVIEEILVFGDDGCNGCNERVTPVTELTNDGCNGSNGCNTGDQVTLTALPPAQTPPTAAPTVAPLEPTTTQTAPPTVAPPEPQTAQTAPTPPEPIALLIEKVQAAQTWAEAESVWAGDLELKAQIKAALSREELVRIGKLYKQAQSPAPEPIVLAAPETAPEPIALPAPTPEPAEPTPEPTPESAPATEAAAEFKVGDRVRVAMRRGQYQGHLGEITSIEPKRNIGKYGVRLYSGDRLSLSAFQIELVGEGAEDE